MEYKSYAKINLFLDIISKKNNGYHGLNSLFSEIDLHDTINYEKNKTDSIRIIDKSNFLPENNLLKKASDQFLKYIKEMPFGIDFYIEKKIPIGGGLGGGSSNAAAVLKILNKEWNANISDKKLENIGAKIGADVPFFISGGLQQVGGIGDSLKPLKSDMSEINLLMLVPKICISTKLAYELIDKAGIAKNEKRNIKKYEHIKKGFKNADFYMIVNNIYNKFEEVIFKEFKDFIPIKEDIINSGAIVSFMSGSGSTMFGIYDTKKSLDMGLGRLLQKGHNCMPVMLKFK